MPRATLNGMGLRASWAHEVTNCLLRWIVGVKVFLLALLVFFGSPFQDSAFRV